MTTKPARLDWDAVRALDPATTLCWASQPLVDLLRAELPFPVAAAVPQEGIAQLVVVGGGSLIDRAKFWRATSSPRTRLIAVPSIWGSGADASPVVVFEREGRKVAEMGAQFLPDARAVWAPLAQQIPLAAARQGWGDVWSHALEAFLSPLANDTLRPEIAAFIRDELLPMPLEIDPRWFDLAAEACWLQSQAGVGLVHGIAHEIEPDVRTRLGAGFGGHAQLCSLLLWPVMRFNLSRGPKVADLMRRHGLPLEDIDARIRELHDPAAFAEVLPIIAEHWNAVLRHPLTRLNAVLVRPEALQFFREQAYELPA